jgi:hypothetical protein
MLLILAQQAVETVGAGGVAGWVTAGTSVSFIAWYMWIHMPAKDKRDAERENSKDALIAGLIASKDSTLTMAQDKFDNVLERIVKGFEGNLDKVLASHKEDMVCLVEKLGESICRASPQAPVRHNA